MEFCAILLFNGTKAYQKEFTPTPPTLFGLGKQRRVPKLCKCFVGKEKFYLTIRLLQ